MPSFFEQPILNSLDTNPDRPWELDKIAQAELL